MDEYYHTYPDTIPLRNTSVAYSTTANNEAENDPWRQDATFLAPKIRIVQGKKWWQKVGWPVGALSAATMATLALLINISVLVWAMQNFQFHYGVAEVFAGDCHKVERINTWVHLGINALSTMLLSGSNYCMQILSAPTRKEIDRAHAQKKWLDIGVPSVRNLMNVASKKVVMWWLLGLSSVPLNLMYNSVFYSTIGTNEYDIVFANEAFVQGGPGGVYNETAYPDLEITQAIAKTWERLERGDCINAYATEFLSTRRNLVAVVMDNTPVVNDSVKQVVPCLFEYSTYSASSFDPYDWICNAHDSDLRYGFTTKELWNLPHCSSRLPKIRTHSESWNSYGWDINYCLSERIEGKCRLSFNLSILVVVMICNIGKALIMISIAFGVRDKPLVTIGDAIDSFLNINDMTTEGMCLISKAGIAGGTTGVVTGGENTQDHNSIIDIYATSIGFHKTTIKQSNIRKGTENWKAFPLEYTSRVKQWSNAITHKRWWTCIFIFYVCMMALISQLVIGITNANLNNGSDLSLKGLIDLGLGAVHPLTLISGGKLPSIGGTTVIAGVLLANSPQPILSLIYLLFNGVFTGMSLGEEWSHFAHERKSLRVSDPKPGQRSTYFLQLPYRYAVPLLILSGVLHWSISQSIFIAQVDSFHKDGTVRELAVISTCGYSIAGIMLTMLIGAFLATFVAVLGSRCYKPGIQLVGSCSAAISAACHGRSDIDTTAPLQWGVTSEDGAQIGHCSFSDRAVAFPREGALYAGCRKRA